MAPSADSASVWRTRVVTCAFALAISILTLQVRMALAPWLANRPSYAMFILPIIFSAYLGGLWPGLISTATCAVGIHELLLKPRHLFWFEGSVELWNWAILIVAGVLVSVLIEELLRSRKSAENASRLNAVTLASIGDAVVTTDRSGRVTFLNAEAERLTEWSHAAARGRPLIDVFRIVHEETRQPLEAPVNRILQTGEIVGLMNHTILVGKNGQETLIEDSGAPIRERDGRIMGVVLVFRDGTAKARAAAKLSESVSLLRTTIEASHDGLLVVDTNRRVTVYNKRFLEIWRIPEEVAIEGDDRKLFRLAMEQAAHAEEAELVESLYAHPDRILTGPIYFKDGRILERTSYPQRLGEKIIGRVWSFREVTEEKKAQAEQSMLAAIVASSDDAIISRKLDGTITSWNRSAERIFGYPAAEAVGKSLPELSPHGIEDEDRKFLSKVARGETFENVEAVRTRKDGRPVNVSITVSPIRNAAGDAIGISEIIRDITEKKLAEEKFAREQARFKLIFDRIPVGIAFHTVHPNGTITRSINDAHLRIAGITREEHDQPDTYSRISHPDDRPIQRQFREQVESGALSHYSIEKRYVHPDGKVVWVNFSYQRETYPDGTLVELTTVVDITAQKLLAEQLRQSQKMEAVGQLSGGIAHDFNNILCVIIGQASMLQMGTLNHEEQANALQQIVQSAERAANLTRQLLAFSRRQIIQTRPLDLNEATSSMIKMLQRLIGEHIVLQTRYASESALVQADPGMIEQVLLNLAVNARDAMPNGGEIFIETQSVRVNTPAVREKGLGPDFIRLSVRDTGCGIAPEHLPRIFEPFFTTKEVGKGTGLGLATVFGIIEQHQGWIEVQSELGKGTTFDIYLPRLRKAGLAAIDQPMTLPVPGHGETILMVEDEAALRALTRNTLERLGYKVLEASTGRMALDIWKQHPEIQLLLTDLVMPQGMSGRELAVHLLGLRPELKVIYMSGYPGDIAGRGLSLREGVNFLQKPFSPIKLAEIVGLAASSV